MKYSLLLSSVFLLCFHAFAETVSPWNLPAKLNETNTQITFSLETKWHTVEGSIKNLTGEAHLTNPKDFRSVQLNLDFPVTALDTDDTSRDENMRESMDAAAYPFIHFQLPSVGKELCSPSLQEGQSCSFTSIGNLSIRNIVKPVKVTATILKGPADSFILEGISNLDWSDFGVKDPSILVARVHKEVSIQFKIILNAKH